MEYIELITAMITFASFLGEKKVIFFKKKWILIPKFATVLSI